MADVSVVESPVKAGKSGSGAYAVGICAFVACLKHRVHVLFRAAPHR